MPQVSVIMSTYSRNHPDKHCPNMLRRALDSILTQKFKDFELILIDDGSTDGTEQVCREYEKQDQRIRLYRFEKNSGRPARRYNDGMRLARADYFMFMFDDDMWLPNAIEDLYCHITRGAKECGMVYGAADTINSQTGQVIKNFAGSWSLEEIRKNNFLCNFSVIVKREAINTVGGYDEDPIFRRNCDWDLWIRIGEKFQVSRMNRSIGICYYANHDSIGVTVPLTDSTKSVIRAKQRSERNIRLKGELTRLLRLRFAQINTDEALLRWALGYLRDALKKEGIDVEIVNIATPAGRESCESADMVMFYRTYDQDSLDFIKRLKVKGKFLLYFIDDYIFQPNCKYAPNVDRLIKPFFEVADVIVASNTKLLDKTPKDKKKIFRRTIIDRETFDLLDPGQYTSSAPNCYAIGWLAGIGRREMNGFVKEMLTRLDGKLGEGEEVHFICFGNHDLGTFKKVKVTEHPYFKPAEWREFYNECRSFAFTVVVNPLDESDEFCHCKSELKHLETGAMRVPLVTARVHPFTEVIQEGKNGFFASTPEEFADKALMVCRNPSLAEKVAETAHEHVREEYDSGRNARKFLADFLDSTPPEVTEQYLSQEAVKLTTSMDKLKQFDVEVVGPVYGGNQLEMAVLLLPACEIVAISVFGATYCKKVAAMASFSLWVNGTRIREGGIKPSEMEDNAWWRITFAPFRIGSGDTLTLRLANQDMDVHLGFYACKNQFVGRARVGVKLSRPIAMDIEAKAIT